MSTPEPEPITRYPLDIAMGVPIDPTFVAVIAGFIAVVSTVVALVCIGELGWRREQRLRGHDPR